MRTYLLAPWIALFVLAGAVLAPRTRAEGLDRSAAPVSAEPTRCFSPGDDVYCWLADGSIQGLASKRVLMRMEPSPGFVLDGANCDVGQGPDAACLIHEHRSEGTKEKPRTRVRLSLQHAHVARWQLAEGISEDGFGANGYAVRIRDGVPTVVFSSHTKDSGQTRFGTPDALRTTRLEVGSFSELLTASSERFVPPLELFTLRGELWAVGRDGRDLVVAKLTEQPTWTRIAGPSMYDYRAVSAADGYVYVFYHDADADSARVVSSQDGEHWRTVELDSAESGWQLDAAPVGYGAVAVWYYMRNTYNKGLRVAYLRGGQELQAAHTLLRNEDHNTGWLPHIGVAQSGQTWVSWLDDVLSHDRAWARLDSPLDLAEIRLKRFGGFAERHKPWYLQAGAGGWYTLWNTFELAPDKKDTNGVQVGQAHRKLANTILLTGMFEARLYRLQLALGYAQSIVDMASRGAGVRVNSYVGSLKFDKLFAGQDVQVRGMIGSYKGSARPGDNADADDVGRLAVDTKYLHLQALALNKWRMKYGLAYSKFHLPSTVNVWSAAAGQTAYQWAGSYFRTVHYDDIRLVLGYSKLDYVARYENRYSGWVADTDALIGAARAGFTRVAPSDQKSVSSSWGLSVGAHLDLGWLWMRRVRALAGLGLYVRPLVRAEFDLILGFKPSDRKSEEAKQRDSSASVSLMSVRYGPWIDLGIVW